MWMCSASTSSAVCLAGRVCRTTTACRSNSSPAGGGDGGGKGRPDNYDGTITGHVHTPLGESDVDLKMRVSRLRDSMLSQRNVGIAAINNHGFRLLDNTMLYGPVAMFPKLALSWRVLTPDQITEDSVKFFTLLEPKLDIVLLGVGDKQHIDGVRKRVAHLFHKLNIGLEVLKTEDAVPLFNYLNDEHRYVAAGLYPPDDIQVRPSQEWAAHAALTPEGKGNQELEGWDPVGLSMLGISRDQVDDTKFAQEQQKQPDRDKIEFTSIRLKDLPAPPTPATRIHRLIRDEQQKTDELKQKQLKTVEAEKQQRQLLLEQQKEALRLEQEKQRQKLTQPQAPDERSKKENLPGVKGEKNKDDK